MGCRVKRSYIPECAFSAHAQVGQHKPDTWPVVHIVEDSSADRQATNQVALEGTCGAVVRWAVTIARDDRVSITQIWKSQHAS